MKIKSFLVFYDIYIGPDRYENIDINKSFKIFEKKSDKQAKFPKEERFFEKLVVIK